MDVPHPSTCRQHELDSVGYSKKKKGKDVIIGEGGIKEVKERVKGIGLDMNKIHCICA